MPTHAEVTLYHNPRCSKSRQTLSLLRDNGVEPEIVEYLKSPPSAAQLKRILQLLDMAPRKLMRKAEAAYREQGLDDPRLSDAQLINAMVEHPVLIERPIAVTENQAAVGRPPENVLVLIR